MERASFSRMQDGTPADYAIIEAAEREFDRSLPDRILHAVTSLETAGLGGFAISRTEHSLQSATRALRDDRESEYVVAALIHDIGDPLAPHSHGSYAASVIRPFVSNRLTWIVEHHPEFQMFYYAPSLGGRKDARDRHTGHPWFADAVEFCEKYDENCFDPGYDSMPIEVFDPLVRDIFGREPFADSHSQR